MITETELRVIFANNVREHRRRLGWTQIFLSKQIGVTTNFMNDIELHKKWASPKNMVKLADLFGVQVYELLMSPELTPGSSKVKTHAATGEDRKDSRKKAKKK